MGDLHRCLKCGCCGFSCFPVEDSDYENYVWESPNSATAGHHGRFVPVSSYQGSKRDLQTRLPEKDHYTQNYIGLNTEGQQLTSSKGNLAGIFKLGWLVSDDGCLLEQCTLSNIGDGAITGISIRKWNAPFCDLKISGWEWNKLAIRLFFLHNPLKVQGIKIPAFLPSVRMCCDMQLVGQQLEEAYNGYVYTLQYCCHQ